MSQSGDASWNHFSEIKWLKSVLKDKENPAEAMAWLRKYYNTMPYRASWGKIDPKPVAVYCEQEYKRLKKEIADEH
jgi:hypothetical protein